MFYAGNSSCFLGSFYGRGSSAAFLFTLFFGMQSRNKTPSNFHAKKSECMERIALHDRINFLPSLGKSVIVTRGQCEYVIIILAQFGRRDGRSTDNQSPVHDRRPLGRGEYHNGNILPFIFRRPLRISDKYLGSLHLRIHRGRTTCTFRST